MNTNVVLGNGRSFMNYERGLAGESNSSRFHTLFIGHKLKSGYLRLCLREVIGTDDRDHYLVSCLASTLACALRQDRQEAYADILDCDSLGGRIIFLGRMSLGGIAGTHILGSSLATAKILTCSE